MKALEEAEDNLVIDPYSRSVIEGAMQVESLKVRDVMVPRSKMIMIDSESSTNRTFAGHGEFIPLTLSDSQSRAGFNFRYRISERFAFPFCSKW